MCLSCSLKKPPKSMCSYVYVPATENISKCSLLLNLLLICCHIHVRNTQCPFVYETLLIFSPPVPPKPKNDILKKTSKFWDNSWGGGAGGRDKPPN